MKSTSRRLTLTRESLRRLTVVDLTQAVGGDIPRPTETCNTCRRCPLETYNPFCITTINC